MDQLNKLGEEERWGGREVREEVNIHSASQRAEEEAMERRPRLQKEKMRRGSSPQ